MMPLRKPFEKTYFPTPGLGQHIKRIILKGWVLYYKRDFIFSLSACTGARLSLLFPLRWWRRSCVRHWPAFRQTCQVSAKSCHTQPP